MSCLLSATLMLVGSPASAKPATGSCALLTRAEIKAVFGRAAAKPTTNAGTCFWDVGGGLGRGGGQVEVSIERGAVGVQDFQDSRSPVSSPVNGLGDQAFLDGEELEVLKGDAYVTLSGAFSLIGHSPSENELHARLIRLGKVVVRRV